MARAQDRRWLARAARLLAVLAVAAGVAAMSGASGSHAAACVSEDAIVAGSLVPCGVVDLENQAYESYAAAHDLPLGDPRITRDGQLEIAGAFWASLKEIVQVVHDGSGTLDSDQQAAYNWFADVLQSFQVNAAQDAQNEYDRWKAGPCTYVPPNPTAFTFRGAVDPVCAPGANFDTLLRGPTPPTYAELLSYGEYDASTGANLLGAAPGASPQLQAVVKDELLRSGLSWLSAFAFPAAAVPAAVMAPQLTLAVNPLARSKLQLAVRARTNALQRAQQQLLDEIAAKEDAALGEDAPEIVTEGSTAGEVAVEEGGIDLGELTLDAVGGAGGAAISAAGFFVVGILATAAIEEGIQVFTEAQIPGQLQSNLDAANQPVDVYSMITGSQALSEQLFEDTLDWNVVKPPLLAQVVDHAPVVTMPRDDGSRIQVGYVYPGSTTAHYVDREQIVPLRIWPVGADQCTTYGCPWVHVAFSGGELWREATPDEAAAGVRGFLPTTTLNYFDWAGSERTAWVQGDHFIDMTGAGSADKGGSDQGPSCDSTAVCNVTNVLFALGAGDQRFRISLKPNPGTQADLLVDNSYGNIAGPDESGPHAGLRAGQTVSLNDPLTNPNGGTTTYKWEVETRCPYDATSSPQTVGGLPVCPGDPSYGHTSLDPSEQDLVSGGSEDAAFHGEPVKVLTGQSLQWVWPAAGTYHVRLITTDQYGVQHVADADETIAGDAPTVPLAVTPAFTAPVAFGPIADGDTAHVDGCIETTAGAYATPSVSIAWGDGSEDSLTGAGASGSLQILYGQSPPSCPSPWSFRSSHTYSVTSTHQVHVPIVVGDGSGQTRTIDIYANLVHIAAPSFVSAASTTFTAGTVGNFAVAATGDPAPTVALVDPGDLPSGLGFGRGVLQGATPVGVGGVYHLTFRATSSAGTVDQSFTLTVNAVPKVTSAGSATLTTGRASTFTFAASGYPTPTVVVSGDTPGGMFLTGGVGSGAATLSGTPAAGSAGTYDLTVRATSSAGTTEQAFTLTVGDTPGFTSPSTAAFVLGNAPSDFTITTSGFPTPTIACQAPCSLPSGLAFHDNGDGTAVVYGAAASGATSSTVVLVATNAAGSTTQSLTVNASLTGGPTIAAAATDDFSVGQSGSFTISSSDPTAVLTELGGLPGGVGFTELGGGQATISGTPVDGSGGYYSLVVLATSSSGPAGIAFVEVRVFGPPTITSPSTSTFAVGASGSFTITASGLPRADVGLSGTLPEGLSFSDPGNAGYATISGTPAPGTAGSYPLSVTAENLENFGSPVQSGLTLVVTEAPEIASDPQARLGDGVESTFTVAASGYPTPALSASGDLPPGVTFTDNGDGTATLGGTPTVSGVAAYPVVVTASSPAGTATQSLTVTVGPLPSVDSTGPASFVVGEQGSFTIRASGVAGGSPPAIGADALPAGLTLTDNGDGTATLSGTPEAGSGGVTTVHVTATDDYGSTVRDLEVDTYEAPSLASGSTLSFFSDSRFTHVPQSWTLQADGYSRASFQLAGDLPSGLTFADNGDGTATIQGIPDAGIGGTYPLRLTMTNFAGSVTTDVEVDVSAPATVTSSLTPTFAAGASNTYTITTSGDPTPTLALLGPPDWLSFTDNGDGTATVSGTPPADSAGTEVDVPVLANNFVGNGDIEMLAIQVSPIGFTAAAPQDGVVGAGYSYRFAATDVSGDPVTYAVAAGASLPGGLTLSGDGLLSGTPTTVGRTSFAVVASTAGGDTGTSGPVTVTVAPAAHELEISEFRTYGPSGASDWYAKVANTTSVGVVVDGWKLVTTDPGRPTAVPLRGTIPAGGSLVVGGALYSLPGSLDILGPSAIDVPGGFQLVAPDGTATDSVGQAGSVFATGAALTVPSVRDAEFENAYVRRASGGALVDTGDNATDFAYQQVEAAPFFDQTLTFDPLADHPVTDSPLTLAATATSGLAVTFRTTTPRVCRSGGTNGATLSLRTGGTCTVVASQPGNAIYRAAASVSRSFVVSETVIHGNLVCRNATYRGVTVRGRVVVSPGASCTLDGVAVDGGIEVSRGGSLFDDGSTVRGKLEADGAAWIDLRGGSVAGGVHVRGTTAKPPASLGDGATANDLCGVDVRGDVRVEGNGVNAPFDVGVAPDCAAGLTVHGDLAVVGNAGAVVVGQNTVRGRVVVEANRGGGSLTGNSARGSCELRLNAPPIVGSGNSARGRNTCNRTG